MGNKLITRASFAELSGVSKPGISKACKAGGKLAPAFDGKHIDLTHPVAVDYLKGKTAKPPKKTGKSAKRIEAEAAAEAEETEEVINRREIAMAERLSKMVDNETGGLHMPNGEIAPEILDTFLSMTLKDITERFGTDEYFETWLKSVKMIETICAMRIKRAKELGTLVSRKLVFSGVVSPYESAHVNILNDGVKTIVSEVIGKHECGEDRKAIEIWTEEKISSFLKPVKIKVSRAMSDV